MCPRPQVAGSSRSPRLTLTHCTVTRGVVLSPAHSSTVHLPPTARQGQSGVSLGQQLCDQGPESLAHCALGPEAHGQGQSGMRSVLSQRIYGHLFIQQAFIKHLCWALC